MLSVVKTAIITIIISFISGVLLDSYKNFAPRILCSLGKAVPLKINNRRIKEFTLIVKNLSNKTIHDLSLNIQGHYSIFRTDEVKITKGLKYEEAMEGNNYNVNIPFLSKNDEFSVKLFVENIQNVNNKPIVTLRSPEDFKTVSDTGGKGFLNLLSKKEHDRNSTNIRDRKLNDNRKDKLRMHKKALIIAAGIFILIYSGILGEEYYNKLSSENSIDIDGKTNFQTKNEIGSSGNTTSSTSTNGKESTGKSKNNTSSINKSDDIQNRNISSASDSKSSEDKNQKSELKSATNAQKKDLTLSNKGNNSKIQNQENNNNNNNTSSGSNSSTNKQQSIATNITTKDSQPKSPADEAKASLDQNNENIAPSEEQSASNAK